MIRLKVLRQMKKISQQKLARELNLSQAAISKYERGVLEPDISTLIRMSKLFDVTTDYLLGNSDFKIIFTDSLLKEDEREILHNYSKLNQYQKDKAIAYIKGLSEQ